MFSILILSENSKDYFDVLKSSEFSIYLKNPKLQGKSFDINSLSLTQYDIAFIDLDSGEWRVTLSLLRQKIPVVAFASADINLAVEAMKMGASDFLPKPLNIENIKKIESRCSTFKSGHHEGPDEIIGKSEQMLRVFDLIKKAAMSDSNVLITGESGTGKEPVARAIHKWSPRKIKPVMTINCNAIPDTLLESELFGFEKGAFTGANYTKKGIFELTDGGTVLLDEIGDVSQLFQIKVLRVLQDGEIMRIGSSHNIKIDLRIIAATNRDLKDAIKRGSFREDLFYRLNVIHIHLPPLRERMVDVPFLIAYFIKKYAQKRKDLLIKGITDDAMSILMNYSYPGNIRELENIIERAISFANHADIYPSDLPSFLQKASSPKRVSKLKEALDKTEKEIIWLALQESRGNITKAAATLDLHRQQLQRKIKHLKIAT